MATVALVGLMGVGKSTVGRLLAERLGGTFVDTDAVVATEAGCSIPELFAEEGEQGFRRREAEVCLRMLASPITVVSLGGGAVESVSVREALSVVPHVVWLRARTETLLARLGSGDGRPLLADDPQGALETLAERRQPWFDEVASLVVDVDNDTPEGVVAQVAGSVASTTTSGRTELPHG